MYARKIISIIIITDPFSCFIIFNMYLEWGPLDT